MSCDWLMPGDANLLLVTRQECETVKEKVARQTTETKCRTEYKEECTQPRAAGYN